LIHSLTSVARAGAKYGEFGALDNDVHSLQRVLDDLTDVWIVVDSVESFLKGVKKNTKELSQKRMSRK